MTHFRMMGNASAQCSPLPCPSQPRAPPRCAISPASAAERATGIARADRELAVATRLAQAGALVPFVYGNHWGKEGARCRSVLACR